MSFEEWQGKVKEWRDLYKVPVDITKVGIYYQCIACPATRSTSVIHRHHKASDFIFALMYPDKYAKRYVQFRLTDCVALCSRCHEEVERYYAPIKLRLYLQCVEDGRLPLNKVEKFKSRFRKAFRKWLSTKRKATRRKRGR